MDVDIMGPVPKKVSQLDASASPNARYVARLNELARDAVIEHLEALKSTNVAEREIARRTRVSIGAIRRILARETEDLTVGTVIALAAGLGLGTVENLLGQRVASAALASRAGEEWPREGQQSA